MLSSAAAVSRSETPVEWSRTASALRALAVLSSSQHSIDGVSTVSVSSSSRFITLNPKKCSSFDWTLPTYLLLNVSYTLTRHRSPSILRLATIIPIARPPEGADLPSHSHGRIALL